MKTTERKTLTLPVMLTDEEKRARGQELAKCHVDKELEELNRKIQAAVAKDKIDGINATAKKLVEALRTGKEDRVVECVEEIDYDKRVANTYRTDLWQLVRSRGLTRDELQISFTGPAPVPPLTADDKVEELPGAGTQETPAPVAEAAVDGSNVPNLVAPSDPIPGEELVTGQTTPAVSPGASNLVSLKRSKKAEQN